MDKQVRNYTGIKNNAKNAEKQGYFFLEKNRGDGYIAKSLKLTFFKSRGDKMRESISLESQIGYGKAYVKGTRISVHQIVRALANSGTIDDLLKIYPTLKKKDILASLAFAADLVKAPGKFPQKLPGRIMADNNGRREIGEYLVIDPNICHGKMTFKGTRIFVEDVLDMVSKGMDWDYIIGEYDGSITKDAIMEAVSQFGKTFAESKERKRTRSNVSTRRTRARKPA